MKHSKRALSFILVCIMLLGSVQSVFAAVTFKDVAKDAYYYDAVQWAVDEGITQGVSATSFAPDKVCTRAEIVTFLWRYAGKPEPLVVSNPFHDVKSTDYYYKAVLWAVQKGITAGTSTTRFSPNDPCTRGQAVTFLWRYAGKPISSVDNPFEDVKDIKSHYFYDAVIWAVANSITAGTSDTTFSPERECSRAQIVTFLYRKSLTPQYLHELKPYNGELRLRESMTDNMKNKHYNCFLAGGSKCEAIYDIGGRYESLAFIVAVTSADQSYYDDINKRGYIKIYGDGELLWENKDLKSTTKPFTAEVDITGVVDLKIVMKGCDFHWGWETMNVLMSGAVLK